MAKKKEEVASDNSLSDFDRMINEQFAEVKDMSKEETAVKSFIDTGNYALNYACSKKLRGGIPVGRISSFWGRSGTGKSLLMAGLCKDQQIDRVFVLSGEGGGITEELFDFIGAPKEKVRYIPVSTTGNYRINKENGKIEEVADKDMPDKLDTPAYIYKRGAILLMKMILNQLEYSGNKTKVLILLDSISILKSVRAFSGGCFVAGTLVDTDKGKIPIEEVKKGDSVLTHLNSYNKVLEAKSFEKEIYELEINGEKIETTAEHPFLIKRDEKLQWVEAQNLNTTDEVMSLTV